MKPIFGRRSPPSSSQRLCRLRAACRDTSLSQRSGALHLPLDHLELEFGNRLGRIETLRAGLGAVHDGVAAIEPERVFEIVEPLAGSFVAAVLDPAGRLQQCGGSEEAVAGPPIARARGRAA